MLNKCFECSAPAECNHHVVRRAMIYLIKKPEKAKQFNEQHKLHLAKQREMVKRAQTPRLLF